MNRVSLALGLLVLLVGSAWLVLQRSDSKESLSLRQVEAEASRSSGAGTAELTESEEERGAGATRSALNQQVPAPSATGSPAARGEVFGVVQAADELPLGERVRVRARWYKETERGLRGELQRLEVEVDEEGRFDFPIARSARGLKLDVLADFLALEAPHRVLKEGREAIQLRPARGGCLMVDLVGRAALDPEAVLGEDFEIQAAVASGWGSLERSAFLGEDGGIRLGGLPPEEGWWIKLKAARFIDAEIAHARVALNARERVEVPVLRGVSAEGLLQAPDGSPVGGASVTLRSWTRPGTRHLPGRESSVETDRDGRFFVGGVLAGEMTLLIEAGGMLTKREELGERIDGEHVDASTIRLKGGGRVSGLVQEADGDPARGAWVSVTVSSRDWNTAEKVRTGKDGRFTVEGLVGERFRVRATWKNRKTKQREIATTTALDGVDVVLTLERGLSVLGSVVDDEGTGLESFVVYATPVGIDEGASPISLRVKKGEGAFELAGLSPGAYEFRATSKGYGKGGRLYLRLPEDAEPVEISLPRLCLFSGVLVDPAGTPVAEAEISGGGESTTSDEEGRFALEDIAPGLLDLRIKVEGDRRLPSETWVLAPGEQREEVLCRLRRGGRILGEIHESSRTGAEFDVSVRRDNVITGQTVTVDGEGRFVFTGLEEGLHWVSFGVSNKADWVEGYQHARPVPVVVPKEGDAHVVLGDPQDYPIRVFGQISRDGEPLGELLIYTYEMGGETLMPRSLARSKADGSYEVRVRTPGQYLFGVGVGQMQLTRHVCDVTDEAEQRFDFEIPSGTFRGRARLKGGTPVAGRMYMLAYEGALKDTIRGGDFLFAHTRSDGTFEFESVAPGKYTLRTGNYVEAHATDGLLLLRNIVIPDEGEPEELELTIPEGAVVDFVAQDAQGTSLPGCKIRLETEDGYPSLIHDMRKTDYRGMLRFTGVGPGIWNAFVESPEGRVLGTQQIVVNEGDRLRSVVLCSP